MRIDFTSSAAPQVDSAVPSKTAQRASATKEATSAAGSAAETDRAQFSFDGGRIASLTAKALAAPEVREAKVASLAQSVASGQYTVDAGKVAGALVSAYSSR
ncbi:MAG TPA: flagellar biosynthesis anti-sigma factor FlgM [Terriglobales bacterium]|nr:flagellar biosynthesis anti-sigma factor FlgM [Terriglobales bacterium]